MLRTNDDGDGDGADENKGQLNFCPKWSQRHTQVAFWGNAGNSGLRTQNDNRCSGLQGWLNRQKKRTQRLNKSNCWQTNGATRITKYTHTPTHIHTYIHSDILIEQLYRSGHHLSTIAFIVIIIIIAVVVVVVVVVVVAVCLSGSRVNCRGMCLPRR